MIKMVSYTISFTLSFLIMSQVMDKIFQIPSEASIYHAHMNILF